MEIIIHGTKDGYRTLYDKTDGIAYNILKDIRNGAKASDSLFGKTFYSLAFVANGCVYTKYVIIKDSLRSFATGTIAFSVFIGTGETMKTEDILKLLNDLYLRYQSDNIRDNNLNRGERELIRENWDFVKDITNEYKTTPKNGIQEEMLSGTKDPAYIYYQDDSDLLRYFEKPFQDEYKDFSQVLLIQSNLQGDTNPLNVLKNSGVELKDIDLKNEPYYLANYDRSKGLTILANGKTRSEDRGNNQIKAKEEVSIKYLKNGRFYEPIEAKGTIINSNSEIHKYLKIDGNQIFIMWDAFNNPTARTKTITFLIKNRNGFPESDAEIIYKNSYKPAKTISNNQATFRAEELGEQWTVSAKKGDDLKSEEIKFTPENQNSPVEIILNEHKKVKFVVQDAESGDNINNFKVWIQGKVDTKEIPEFEFIGEDFDKTWYITFEKQGYNRSETVKYNPKNDGNTVYGQIKKKEKSVFFGKSENGNKEDDKKKNFFVLPRGIIISSVAVLALVFGIWLLFFKSEATSETLEEKITDYVEGIEIFDDKLRKYKNQWDSQTPEIKIEKKSWLSMFGIGNKEEKIDSTDYKNWKEVSKSIKRAIAKRGFINDYNFDSLKVQRYSTQQQKFEDAIVSVTDSTKYGELKNKFGDNFSSWHLNQIADSISDFLNPPVKSEVKEPKEEVKEDKKVIDEPKKVVEQSKKQEQKNVEQKDTASKNTEQQQQKEFEDGFWNVVHKSEPPKKEDFDEWFRSGNKISDNNEYKKFYNKYLSTTQEFEKIKDFLKKPFIERKQIRELTKLKEQLK